MVKSIKQEEKKVRYVLRSIIPASKISNLTQGMFVGAVSENFDERIDQKIFHAQIVIDNAKVAAETNFVFYLNFVSFFICFL